MKSFSGTEPWARTVSRLFALALVSLLALPVSALVISASSFDFGEALKGQSVGAAVGLSLKTSSMALGLTLLLGLPLSWWLASAKRSWTRLLDTIIELPIVLPPAVMGVGLLQAFGRNGLWGGWLSAWGISIPFTESAVVMAQLIVSAPFFVQSASQAFRRLDPELLLVARSLGASESRIFWRVVLPLSLPGLISGACLSWARALGEFGATLLFAGNRPGITQTMPLAIFTALESSLETAVALSLLLGALGVALLIGLRVFVQRMVSPE